jgi:Family of unknown function (DUF5994)
MGGERDGLSFDIRGRPHRRSPSNLQLWPPEARPRRHRDPILRCDRVGAPESRVRLPATAKPGAMTGPPATSATAGRAAGLAATRVREPRASDASRVTWGPKIEGPHLAAAWWPRTRDAAVELPPLIDAASAQMGGPVTRVSLNIDAWDLPHLTRLTLPSGVVRLGWFRQIDPHLVTVGRGTYDRISVAVMPPDLDAIAIRRIRRRLQSASPWPSTPAALLEPDDAAVPLDR